MKHFPLNEFALGLYDFFRELSPSSDQPAFSLCYALGRSTVGPHGLIKQELIYQRRHDDVFDIYSAQFCLPQSSSEQELPTLFGLLEEQPAILPLEHQVLIATLRSEGRL